MPHDRRALTRRRTPRVPRAGYRTAARRCILAPVRPGSAPDPTIPLHCPRCRYALHPRPRRRRPCPSCGVLLSVRTRQTLFSAPLLTPAQLRAWTHYERWTRQLHDPLVPLRDALRYVEASESQLDDTIELWYRAIVQSAPRWPWRWLDRLARFRLEAGRPHLDVVDEARAMEVAALLRRHRPPVLVAIVPGHPGALCTACTARRHERVRLTRALGRGPLPVAGCTCVTGRLPGLCTCWYAVQDDPRPTATLAEWALILAAFAELLTRRGWR